MKLTVIAVIAAALFAVAPQVATGSNVAQVKSQVVAQVVTGKRAEAARATIKRAVVQRADIERAVIQRADIQRAHVKRLSINRLR